MAIKMKNTQRKRLNQLSSDTTQIVFCTFYRLVDSYQYLLNTEQEDLMLSFNTLKNGLGNLYQGLGGK